MKHLLIVLLAAAVLSGGALWFSASTGRDARADVTAGGEELSPYMIRLQQHVHKLSLSLDAGNKDLAAFYVKELVETADDIEKKFPEYDGFQIGALMKVMLRPSFDPVSKAVEGGNIPAASAALDKLMASCNTCHVATQHAFLKIERVKTNPFAQSFK